MPYAEQIFRRSDPGFCRAAPLAERHGEGGRPDLLIRPRS